MQLAWADTVRQHYASRRPAGSAGPACTSQSQGDQNLAATGATAVATPLLRRLITRREQRSEHGPGELRDDDGSCPLCSQLDAKAHCIFLCPALAVGKGHSSHPLQTIQKDFPFLAHMTSAYLSCSADFLSLLLQSLQLPKLAPPSPTGSHLWLFADGRAQAHFHNRAAFMLCWCGCCMFLRSPDLASDPERWWRWSSRQGRRRSRTLT